jgi:hypothetical protein
MRQVLGGAVLVILGIAAFIEASSHAPEYTGCPNREGCLREAGGPKYLVSGHLSQTPYDLLRIGAWALVIIGALLVVTGLIRYWRSPE